MKQEEAILVTGCGNGLGLALVETLCALPYRVFAGLRNMADAHKLPASAVALLLDVTNKQHITDALHDIENSGCTLKALVNNAGVYEGGPVEYISEAAMKRVFDVNFFGALSVAQAFLPMMRAQKSGEILMVSSLSGLLALPGDSIYAASKHALEAASESLAVEVAPWNINVTLLEPGAFATGLFAGDSQLEAQAPYDGMLAGTDGGRLLPSPAAAAKEIANLIENPVADLRYAIGDQAKALLPKINFSSQKARRDFILDVSGTGPWVSHMQ